MAALTATNSVLAGTLPSAVAVSASDTIAAGQFGPTGVDLRVINGGGSPDTVTIADPNLTVMGSAATNPTVSVTNATTKVIFIPVSAINPSTQLVTVTHSFTTSVTCEVWKR
jgi:hypothetical protein